VAAVLISISDGVPRRGSGLASLKYGHLLPKWCHIPPPRVSTVDQTTANRERELREIASRIGYAVMKVYKDHGVSGAKGRDERPQFDALCRDAPKRQFDVVMAWSVDRLGRSLQDLVGFVSKLHALKIDLYLHQQGIDTTMPAGKALFQMMGVFCRVRAVDDSGTSPRWT
jgi:Resolvase, N terminal domain